MKPDKKNYSIVVDVRRCVGCNACMVACKLENKVSDGYYRLWVLQTDKDIYPNVTRVKIAHLCNECKEPPCVPVCPVNATSKNTGGIITIDDRQCIGCGNCVKACPYSARHLKPDSGKADKCNMCFNRVSAGLLPACVTNCVAHALFFGDLNDPRSEVSMLLKKHKGEVIQPKLGTAPNVYYIGLSETLKGVDYQSLIKNGPYIMTP